LEGYSLASLKEGKVSLYWRAKVDSPTDYLVRLEVLHEGHQLGSQLLGLAPGELQPSHWLKGERVIVHYSLPTSKLSAGEYTFAVHLLMGDKELLGRDVTGKPLEGPIRIPLHIP